MDKDSKTIRVQTATQERLTKLAKELGLSVTSLASSMIESQIDKIYETGGINLTIKRDSDNKASIRLNQ